MLQKLIPPPGVIREITQYAAENSGWYDTDKVRFRSGYPEKIGGWEKFITDQLLGTPRSFHVHRTLKGTVILSIGTEKKVYIVRHGTLIDITPIRRRVEYDANAIDPFQFDTANSDKTVTLTLAGHGCSTGDYINIGGMEAVGGITPDGNYVVTVTDKETLTFEHASQASSTANSNGIVGTYIDFEVGVGAAEDTYGDGWGACGWSTGTWNDTRDCDDILIQGRLWSLDNWGEDLIMNPWGGGVYKWKASNPNEHAVVVPNAPTKSQMIQVTDNRHIVCFGCNYSADSKEYAPSNIEPERMDTMRIQWCDQANSDVWDINDEVNKDATAGDFRLTGGSQILAASKVEGGVLIWTEQAVHTMAPVDPPLNFRFDQVGESTGIMSPFAHATHNGVTFWMGDNNFYVYQGGVKNLACTVKQYVFDGLNFAKQRKVFAGLDRRHNEVWWWYPTTTEPNRYVVYSMDEDIWWIGSMDRTAWIDRGMLEYPIGASSDGYLYEHEKGVDADGAKITSYAESSEFDIGEGDRYLFVRRVLPDFQTLTGSVDFTIKTRRYPHSSQVSEAIGTITSATEKISARVRGRQASILIESDTIGDNWRYGATRADIQEDGGKN